MQANPSLAFWVNAGPPRRLATTPLPDCRPGSRPRRLDSTPQWTRPSRSMPTSCARGTLWPLAGEHSDTLAAADVNDDGRTDLLALDRTMSVVTQLSGIGDGSFLRP